MWNNQGQLAKPLSVWKGSNLLRHDIPREKLDSTGFWSCRLPIPSSSSHACLTHGCTHSLRQTHTCINNLWGVLQLRSRNRPALVTSPESLHSSPAGDKNTTALQILGKSDDAKLPTCFISTKKIPANHTQAVRWCHWGCDSMVNMNWIASDKIATSKTTVVGWNCGCGTMDLDGQLYSVSSKKKIYCCEFNNVSSSSSFSKPIFWIELFKMISFL